MTTTTGSISIAQVDANRRLRKALPSRSEALAEDIGQHGLLTPIEVVGPLDDGTYRLIYGAHRLAAVKLLGWQEVPAVVHAPDTFADDAQERLREIRENLIRFELNALERAVSVAAWRDIYEAAQGKVKPGRKAKTSPDDISAKLALIGEEAVERFSASFSEAAQTAFSLSRRDVFRALKIATIPHEIRDRIADCALAGNQSELLKLAEQSADRQAQIVGMILAEPPLAATVEEAIAVIDKLPPAPKPGAWEKVSDKFSRLKQAEQHRFFNAHSDAVDLWLAKRG